MTYADIFKLSFVAFLLAYSNFTKLIKFAVQLQQLVLRFCSWCTLMVQVPTSTVLNLILAKSQIYSEGEKPSEFNRELVSNFQWLFNARLFMYMVSFLKLPKNVLYGLKEIISVIYFNLYHIQLSRNQLMLWVLNIEQVKVCTTPDDACKNLMQRSE